MFGEIFDAASNQSALWAVILGAILATFGGFAATQIERYIDHRRRERNSALFFGELLTTFRVILGFVHSTHGRGDPYGPITMRMLKSAQKEIEIYDRNRESLFDLRHSDLRARIQTLIIRMTMPIEGVFETTQEIVDYQTQLQTGDHKLPKSVIDARIEELKTQREGAYEFIMETTEKIPAIIADLELLAQHSFRNIDEIVGAL